MTLFDQADALQKLFLVGHVRLEPFREGRGVGIVARALMQPLGEIDVGLLLHGKAAD